MHSVCLSTHLSAQCAHSNSCKYFKNVSMLLISDIEWTVLKMVCMGLGGHLQRHTKVLIHYGLWGKIFQNSLQHIYVTLNIVKLTHVIKIYKNMFVCIRVWQYVCICMNVLAFKRVGAQKIQTEQLFFFFALKNTTECLE